VRRPEAHRVRAVRKAYDLAVWDPAKFRDMVAHARGLGETASCWMTPEDYADVRKFGRDVIDLTNDPILWKTGNMGSVYGVTVMMGRQYSHLGVVSFFGPGLPIVDPAGPAISHVVNARRWAKDALRSSDHSLSFHPGDFLSCPDGLCLSMLVMSS
jgi:hypothetical protein